MKLNLECIPCFLRQALQAVRFISDDERLGEQVLREVMQTLLQLQWNLTPPELAVTVHQRIRRLTKNNDPYKLVKKKSNDLVLKLYPELEKKVKESPDLLRTALRLAIAGNIIDFGALREFNLQETIRNVLNRKFAIDDYNKLKETLQQAETLLFFADNAGEIGFDRLLLETLLKETRFNRIKFVVKGGPIINDATLADALYVGLGEVPNIEFATVSNGDTGTGPERRSLAVKGWIATHDLVLAKGQGNYESLSEHNGIFFLLMAKCPIIASDLGVDLQAIVLKYNP